MKTNIGVFDSGIGGVTVLRECLNTVTNFKYIYYSDSINNPYGDKDKDELMEIVSKIVEYLIKKNCRVIIIACNTASAICVAYLRDKYKDIQFIAIEPALKVAYDNNIKSNTLVLATKGTLDSDKFRKLHDKYSRKKYYLHSCVGLANLIEASNREEIDRYLSANLVQYRDKVSSVVLGCTHYPLIINNIRKVLGDVIFYDGSIGVSKQLKRIIDDNMFVPDNDSEIEFIDSSNNMEKKDRFYNILGGNYE